MIIIYKFFSVVMKKCDISFLTKLSGENPVTYLEWQWQTHTCQYFSVNYRFSEFIDITLQ